MRDSLVKDVVEKGLAAGLLPSALLAGLEALGVGKGEAELWLRNKSFPIPAPKTKALISIPELKETTKHQPTAAIDLDGTLAEYSGWQGEDHFGAVRPGAREALLELRNNGWKIIIFTTRGNVAKVEEWLDANGLPFDFINRNDEQPDGSNPGKPIADLYIDDRAIDASKPWPDIMIELRRRQADKRKASRQAITKDLGPHKFASTQLQITDRDALKKLLELGLSIPDHHLAEKGRETDVHLTIKYGITHDDPEPVRRLVSRFGPVTVQLGKTSVFKADGHDVVIVDVDSQDVLRLNRLLSDQLPHTDTYPKYVPHVTVAFVRPGLGQLYAALPDLEGTELTFDALTHSDAAGNRTLLPLLQESVAKVAPSANGHYKGNGVLKALPPASDEYTELVFGYGTLLSAGRRRKLFSRDVPVEVAILPGWVKEGDNILQEPFDEGGSVIGVAFWLSKKEVALNDGQERPYVRTTAKLVTGRTVTLWIEPKDGEERSNPEAEKAAVAKVMVAARRVRAKAAIMNNGKL